MLENVCLVFLKYPQEGKVKTRLGKVIGHDQAVALYTEFVEILLRKIEAESHSVVLCFSPQEKEEEIKEWLGPRYAYYLQQGEDLGSRLENAFGHFFSSGAKKIVVIGVDDPLLDSEIIKQAIGELDYKDIVLGPASDGGYYLLGASSFIRAIFEDIPWSTGEVLEKTVAAAQENDISVSFLEAAFDVDERADLVRLQQVLSEEKYQGDPDYEELAHYVDLALGPKNSLDK